MPAKSPDTLVMAPLPGYAPGTVKYVRLQVRYLGKLGLPVGIFGACHHLQRAGRLSPADDQLFSEVDAWFTRELPEPPFYEDGNSIKAITWFKSSATRLLDAVVPLRGLLERYGVEYDVVETDEPGRIIYEDDFQVGVVDVRLAESHASPEVVR